MGIQYPAIPWIFFEGRRICGSELQVIHQARKSVSYHCLMCGAPQNGDCLNLKGPCWNCNTTEPFEMLIKRLVGDEIERIKENLALDPGGPQWGGGFKEACVTQMVFWVRERREFLSKLEQIVYGVVEAKWPQRRMEDTDDESKM